MADVASETAPKAFSTPQTRLFNARGHALLSVRHYETMAELAEVGGNGSYGGRTAAQHRASAEGWRAILTKCAA